MSARVEEADVRDALVDRDMGESILCRWRYRILPGFSPGDCPYVVSPLGWLVDGMKGVDFCDVVVIAKHRIYIHARGGFPFLRRVSFIL